MIKYSTTILLFLALFSCKNKSSVQDSINTEINNIIQKHKLYARYIQGGSEVFFLTEDGLFATLYSSMVTDTCLYVLKNSKNNVLLFQLDSGINNYHYSVVIKQNNDYFFLLREFEKTKYSDRERIIPLSYKLDDYVKYFKIDTAQKSLIQIDRFSDLEIINLIKDEFNLNGEFYMVHTPFEIVREGYNEGVVNTLITIAKDTLEDYQIYYQIKGIFKPRKVGECFKLFPVFNDISRFGIFKDNIGYEGEDIGWTYHSLSYKSYYDYLRPCGTILSYKHIRTEIIHRSDSSEKILAVLKNEDIFYESNDPPPHATGITVGIFRYFNGEYFVTVNPEQVLVGEFPPIFHLDTINWVLNKIKKFDPSVDKKYSNLPKKNLINSLIDGIMDWEQRLFFESFEIVKVDNEYKLLIKN